LDTAPLPEITSKLCLPYEMPFSFIYPVKCLYFFYFTGISSGNENLNFDLPRRILFLIKKGNNFKYTIQRGKPQIFDTKSSGECFVMPILSRTNNHFKITFQMKQITFSTSGLRRVFNAVENSGGVCKTELFKPCYVWRLQVDRPEKSLIS